MVQIRKITAINFTEEDITLLKIGLENNLSYYSSKDGELHTPKSVTVINLKGKLDMLKEVIKYHDREITITDKQLENLERLIKEAYETDWEDITKLALIRNVVLLWIKSNFGIPSLKAFTHKKYKTEVPDNKIDTPEIIKAAKKLATLYISCQKALDEEWNKSDEGFEAMQIGIEDIANLLKIKDIVDEYIEKINEAKIQEQGDEEVSE